ncbi:MAG TPA: GNAT family N-acetyltransferase [Gammaproteobacteria bacterium]
MPQVFITPRFTLRAVAESDLDALLRNFSDRALMRYYDGTPLDDLAAVRELLETWRRRERKGTGLRWAIARKDNDELIGTFGLHDIDRRARCAQIGCEVARAYWGRKVMNEIAPVIGRHVFEELDLRRLDACIAPRNRASIALIESLGFRRRRLLRQRMILNGRRSDVFLYSMTRARYRALVRPGVLATLAEMPALAREMLAGAIHEFGAPYQRRVR